MATKKKQANGKQAETASIAIDKSKLAHAGAELAATAAVAALVEGVGAVAGGVFTLGEAAATDATAQAVKSL